ncbi:MAG: SUMF1/EgtB/PvdO family nonheme iron enzyme [Anaerolineae bacterium]|nr:SUMF1/EgtB/PvdO family nonheme iron enzyme [Anaerolineae bacterium]
MMKIFISYARIDKSHCLQIANLLEMHKVWHDQRLYAGQHWWKEILRRLEWCDGFVYLISSDSLASEYCQNELEIAQSLGRYIFPVIIEKGIEIPPHLAELQYTDFSEGITGEAVAHLIKAIYFADQDTKDSQHSDSNDNPTGEAGRFNEGEPSLLSRAVTAMEEGQYDRAVFLFNQVRAKGYQSRFINIDALLKEAEAALNLQMRQREMEHEYQQIAHLSKHPLTQAHGCKAFKAFREDFPDYDPDNLAGLCAKKTKLAVAGRVPENSRLSNHATAASTNRRLEWCEIPSGTVKTEESHNAFIESFLITKYPITNSQYQVFLRDPKGYANPEWWDYSDAACKWRMQNSVPPIGAFTGENRPRETVNWFDAVAFCRWLSSTLEAPVALPTLRQRQRAIQGNDNRIFPWGSKFDKSRCNTRESELRMTTEVDRYESGVSPYGVYDLVGNVWEWCLDTDTPATSGDLLNGTGKRIVHGGAFVGPYTRCHVSFHYYLEPHTLYSSIGFRVVMPRMGR